MRQNIKKTNNNNLFKNLKIDCEKCFGLCCVALYFSKSEGFPNDKVPGKPCANLQSNFHCSVHNDLRKKGFKGCTIYDCFGAGQKVSQVTFKDQSWIDSPELASQMFDSFLIIRQLHEMLWYLADASTFILDKATLNKLNLIIEETQNLTILDPNHLKNIDIKNHRIKVNDILRKSNNIVKIKLNLDKKNIHNNKKVLIPGYDFIGLDLTSTNLIGANLSGSLLIASNLSYCNLKGANLIGADLRDANIRGANLENALFLNQSQVNSAIGNSATKLPFSLNRPFYWEK